MWPHFVSDCSAIGIRCTAMLPSVMTFSFREPTGAVLSRRRRSADPSAFR